MVCETCGKGCYLKSRGVCGITAVTLSISVASFFLMQHISKGRKMILGLLTSKVYVNCRTICKFSEMLSE